MCYNQSIIIVGVELFMKKKIIIFISIIILVLLGTVAGVLILTKDEEKRVIYLN